jgi:hypothetical protein
MHSDGTCTIFEVKGIETRSRQIISDQTYSATQSKLEYTMGLFFNLTAGIKKESESKKGRVSKQSEMLIEIVNESIQIAKVSPNLEVKKARLEYAMKKVIDLIALINRHPSIDSKKLSSLYVSIREVRNEIKSMESTINPFGKREVA